MLLPCEVAVKTVIPAIRSAIVKIMYNELGFKQVEIAESLNITQAAVSQYIRGIRGTAISVDSIPEIHDEIISFINKVIAENISRDKQVIQYCKLCNIIRAKGLMCKTHKQYDLTLRTHDCRLCKSFKCGFNTAVHNP
jgi:predicted transcriptional regulator